MFDWLKPKSDSSKNTSEAPLKKDAKKDKSALIKEAMVNAREARETIGQETLDRVLDIMNRKKQAMSGGDSTNPSLQAKKIMLQMDKGKVADHLKDLMHSDMPPQKH
jgi:hypothetical protein